MKAGAPADYQAEGGDTPLFAASRFEFMRVAEQLLKYGANPLQKNSKGETPLAVVEKERNRNLIELYESYIK